MIENPVDFWVRMTGRSPASKTVAAAQAGAHLTYWLQTRAKAPACAGATIENFSPTRMVEIIDHPGHCL